MILISFNIFSGEASRCIFFTFFPNSTIRLSVATRTLKNSSRLLEKIPRKRILSRSGTVSSPASCKTLPLNASQLISLTITLRLSITGLKFSFSLLLPSLKILLSTGLFELYRHWQSLRVPPQLFRDDSHHLLSGRPAGYFL